MYLLSPEPPNLAINIKEVNIEHIKNGYSAGCESWNTILADEHKLRVIEYKVLRKIYMPKRDEMTGE